MGKKFEDEVWIDVEGSNHCKVSNYGRVRRDRKILHQTKEREGYLLCSFGGELGRQRVHRIVAKYFCENPNPEEYDIIDHKNGKKDDNRAENLRWCNVQMNTQWGYDNNQRQLTKRGYVGVADIENGNELTIYKSGADAARELGIRHQALSQSIAGTKQSVKGKDGHHYACFRIHDIRLCYKEEDEASMGFTLTGGNFAEVEKNSVKIKISDNREESFKSKELATIGRKLLDKFYELTEKEV